MPETTPHIRRHCAGCNATRAFASSDKFRVNANGRRVDVWLIYRCAVCERTWNRTIYERVAVASLGDSIDALSGNDRDLAWRWAFRVDDLTALGARVDEDVAFRVDRGAAEPPAPGRIRFAVHYPCAPRLDRVLAHALRISRSQIRTRARSGVIDAAPRALRRPVRHDQVVNIRSR